MQNSSSTFFAPQLYINDCAAAIEFYKKAFGVMELNRWSNDDGSVHVAELSWAGCLFHIHEPTEHSVRQNQNSPENLGGITTLLGVFVDDPHAVVKRAVEAGAHETSPVTDYEYHYRQGTVTDPFGHQWLIEKKI
ncbi:MAG TPA: VOC family protein [Puia sp.]|nr:VOC family protein [Puia sp.]